MLDTAWMMALTKLMHQLVKVHSFKIASSIADGRETRVVLDIVDHTVKNS